MKLLLYMLAIGHILVILIICLLILLKGSIILFEPNRFILLGEIGLATATLTLMVKEVIDWLRLE